MHVKMSRLDRKRERVREKEGIGNQHPEGPVIIKARKSKRVCLLIDPIKEQKTKRNIKKPAVEISNKSNKMPQWQMQLLFSRSAVK